MKLRSSTLPTLILGLCALGSALSGCKGCDQVPIVDDWRAISLNGYAYPYEDGSEVGNGYHYTEYWLLLNEAGGRFVRYQEYVAYGSLCAEGYDETMDTDVGVIPQGDITAETPVLDYEITVDGDFYLGCTVDGSEMTCLHGMETWIFERAYYNPDALSLNSSYGCD